MSVQWLERCVLHSSRFSSLKDVLFPTQLILEARSHDSQYHCVDPSGTSTFCIRSSDRIELRLWLASKGLNDLEGGLDALEKFSSCVSSYVSWWNVINMTHVSQTTRLDQVVVNYNSLRYKDVVKKWEELGQEYVEYSQKVSVCSNSFTSSFFGNPSILDTVHSRFLSGFWARIIKGSLWGPFIGIGAQGWPQPRTDKRGFFSV